ncbi:glutamate receptor 3.7-like isoform X1 [Magnolia sinica]|uniref:glutamate receptor 3.7-like isoform X1 n=1 Tax=Magnolia sinica TaxID=86752 RepID=UPI00265888BF|nr:glutamate receptor 3.7-like isoform X1 [Magnolia sinica]XP_058093355.1 glutamate receptor 3.7-like isoform X1 [Magnolia sinica]
MGVTMFASVSVLIWALIGCVDSRRPDVVNIGAVFTYNSTIGIVAKVAIEAAVADVNADSSILSGTKLNLTMEDSNCNVFTGAVEAFQVLENGAVAVIGPQSSSIAHMISFIADGLQIPLVSFAATDPTLSALQFPFFLRTTLSDSYQMTAMADLILHYNWREVIAIFVDDDHGRNGIAFLEDMLAKRMARIHYKIALPVHATRSYLMNKLNESKLTGTRTYVVHVGPNIGLEILSVAHQLEMVTVDYAWLVTDWLCAALDSSQAFDRNLLQGVVSFRQHFPESSRKTAFVSRWRELLGKGTVSSKLNAYGFYAYDTVWVVAHAIDKFLNEYGNISFSYNDKLDIFQGTKLHIEKLKVFDGGKLLFEKLLQTSFTGLTGPVHFDYDRNLMNGSYEVVNVDRTVIRRVGYWSNFSGLSVLAPERLNGKPRNSVSSDQQLGHVTWPGGKTEKPRGWVLATNERPLIIGVPKRASFVEFVIVRNDTSDIEGYCIDVFKEAQKLLPYPLPYKFVPFGDGWTNPSYDELVHRVQTEEFEAAVGDIAIVTNRTKIVDFTQPYIATGLVIVAPIKSSKSSAWVFLQPFTVEMWCVTGAFFFLIGFVIWLLEHRTNDDFRGPPRRQFITMLLFSFSTLFKTNQEETLSTLARMVMIVWLFLLMVITSSYTASLTSILTIQQLSSPITGIDSLIASNERIGYPVESFARSYMIESLNIPPSRLVVLHNPEEYERALRLGPKVEGGVAAIVDELPYIKLFLSKRDGFGIIGDMFTKSGWGFAFQRDSPLAVDMSSAILRLSENGKLQELHEKWFCNGMSCEIQQNHRGSDPNHLHINSFWGLFLLCGVATLIAFFVFLLRSVCQFAHYRRKERDHSNMPEVLTRASFSQVIYRFFDFIDEKEEVIKNMFKQHESTEPQVS